MPPTPKNFNDFIKTLLVWYRKEGRKLPWRKESITPYEVWVSEVMLQQTQVSRVEGFYTNFLKRFPNMKKLAGASWEEFLPYYQGLGYYNRGRNMLETAKIVSAKYNGRFPREKKQLMKFSGVGEYTANAILAFAFDEKVLAVDTNTERVLNRYFPNHNAFGGLASKSIVGEDFVAFLMISRYSGREVNSALMDFGSIMCVSKPKKEDHENHPCPFGKKCRCFNGVINQSSQKSQKKRSVRKTFSMKDARVYIFLHKNHREYYSKNKKTYKPFLLPKGETSRTQIKKYFYEKYDLVLSVRPPFRKTDLSGEPFLFVNAQILKGEHAFYTYEKKDVGNFQKKVLG